MPVTKSFTTCALFLASLMVAGPACAGDAPASRSVAIVTDLAGTARATHDGQTGNLAVLDTLADGDRLQLESGTSIEIVFPNGNGVVLTVSGPARLAIGRDDATCASSPCRIVRRNLFGKWNAVLVHPESVGRASVSLRGGAADRIELLAPVGAWRAGDLAALRWAAPARGDAHGWHYEARVLDEQGELLWSGASDELSSPLPAGMIAGWRGAGSSPLIWTVSATSADGQSAEGAAQFRLLGPGEEQQLERLRADAANARGPGGAPVAEDVLYAMSLDEARMPSEAGAQWQRLAAARPALREVAAIPR